MFDKILIVKSYFKTIVGQAAEGRFYFQREEIDELFWKYINKGAHLLISAPRRVGKTSFLKHMAQATDEKYLIKYHTTESINSSDEYFKKLYKSLIEELSGQKTTSEYFKGIFKSHGIKNIGPKGIELTKSDLDYFEEFKRLVIETQFEKKYVFIVDEFSETLENIILDQGEAFGKNFLHQNRELRQESAIHEKIQFIYSGSIGLGNIAERILASKTINDLRDFSIKPFGERQALDFIAEAILSEEIEFSEEIRFYLLGKIEWLIPFYIQILLDEIENQLNDENKRVIDQSVVDQAISRTLEVRTYFEHWYTRLRVAFKGREYTFSKELLNLISKSDSGITKSEIFDFATKLELEDSYDTMVRTLIHDGYIHRDTAGRYRYNSPLLKIWWERNISV